MNDDIEAQEQGVALRTGAARGGPLSVDPRGLRARGAACQQHPGVALCSGDGVVAGRRRRPPSGRGQVSPEEFLRLSKIEGFQLVTASDRAAKAAAHVQEVADDEAYVQSMLGGDPRLSGWIPPLGQPGPFEKRADGSFLVTLPGASPRVVASNSRENVVQALAASLRATKDRANLLQRYTSLIDRLPLDQRQDLPTAATIDQVDTSTLATQVRKLEQRLSESVPRQILPQGIAPGGDPGAGTGCSQPEEVPGKTIGDRIDWQLEPYETPIRDQGERGTCSAFAVTAGLETAVYRRLGLPIDLSEQELYAEARDNWLIDPLDYHDGIWAGTITDRMARENFRLDAEVRWPYNPSTKRETVPGLLEWRYSCDDYHHVCSNTNHQKGVVCSQAPPPFMGTYCAHHQPEPATIGGNIGNVRLKSSVSLWNPFEPDNSLASVRAHLDAGHPVVAGLYLDKNFTFAGLELGEFRGWVEERSVPAEAAPHSVLIVGYVLEGDLPNSVRDFYSGFGGGYFVIKNSWGCNGDKGHWFASFDYF